MALPKVQFMIQLGGYIVGLIMSLCIVIPMSLHQADFDGHCILFSTGLRYDNTWEKLIVNWASSYYCHYILFVGVLSMVACWIQIYRLLMQWYEGRSNSFLPSFLEAAGCALLAGALLSAGVLLSLGFITWCQSITNFFPSCQDVAGHAIEDIPKEFTDGFYSVMETTQIGAWAVFATFVGLGVAATLDFLECHQRQNIHAVLASDHDNERQPLLNSGFPQDGQSTPPLEEP